MQWHEPVLVEEVLSYLAPQPHWTLVDGTAGLGGHSRRLAQLLTDGGRLISIDRDAQSLEIAKSNLADVAGRITFVHSRFSRLRQVLDSLGVEAVNGLLVDCGVSRYQLTSPGRGFSFDSDAVADMRMDQSENTETASDIVNFGSEEEIARILFELGEERRARRVARAIVRARPIRSVHSLADVIESVVARAGRVRGSTKSLQALRIYVNSELDELDALLSSLDKILAPGARVVFITFHSLEDRPVKRWFQSWHKQGRAQVLTKHVVTPGEEEIRRNPAARSAKLRALEWRG
ncbi:MAG: 16S rRNA (cytosine(1402)-N(4))-methyltransferase RsmH [Bryobacterales bacterium]|nr:16S rRNA (cytosine(1402)-N(4))-methyltransferase RsmH [Bryobacterales bacterium]